MKYSMVIVFLMTEFCFTDSQQLVLGVHRSPVKWVTTVGGLV